MSYQIYIFVRKCHRPNNGTHIVNRDVLWTKEFSSQERQGTTTKSKQEVVQLQTPTSLNGTTLQNGTHQMASNWAEDYLKEVPELKTNGAANQLYGNILYSWLCLPALLLNSSLLMHHKVKVG